ncbi:hypothetical protein ACI77O_11910 [Pseudomonas tritici]|uniref:hypothetical protein n=1 Tax=Pseudomonas tritici TaxID=2745518 RepID=UPI00387B0C3F
MLNTLDSQADYTRPAGARWNSFSDLQEWMSAFATFFPRKAHLVSAVAARLCNYASYDELSSNMQYSSHRLSDDGEDDLFAAGRMMGFREDRLTLIGEFRILPDAADYFLTACPVGASRLYSIERQSQLDESLCYYQDDQNPSDSVNAIVGQQLQSALGQNVHHAASQDRIGEFHHPEVIISMCHYLGLDFTIDCAGRDGLDDTVPAMRIGWINDKELGSIECISLNFTVNPNWGRDELFRMVCALLKGTSNRKDKTLLLLNKHPQQLVKTGNTFTSIGHIMFENSIEPLFISPHRLSLADLLIEVATFDPSTSLGLVDAESKALNVYWHLLSKHDEERLPTCPMFKAMPDNWMLPNW